MVLAYRLYPEDIDTDEEQCCCKHFFSEHSHIPVPDMAYVETPCRICGCPRFDLFVESEGNDGMEDV